MLVDIQKLFLYVGVGLFGDQKTRKSVLSFHLVGPGDRYQVRQGNKGLFQPSHTLVILKGPPKFI